MNLLRAVAAFWLGLSIIILMYVFSAGAVGFDSHSNGGKGYMAAGSHPALLAWSAFSIVLVAVLFRLKVEEIPDGIPSGWRRFFAFLMDLWFIGAILASLGGLVPLWIESRRTGHFAWHFERNYSVPSDDLVFPLVLISLAVIFLYFVWPLTKGKQTLGCFILRLRVAPPFGLSGAFTFQQAVRRVWMELTGTVSVLSRRNERDSQGRTWYDRETNSTVILIKYEE